MRRFRELAAWPPALHLLTLIAAASLACGGGCQHDSSSRDGAATSGKVAPPGGSSTKVGNGDPHGVENQPNWAEMSRELRTRVEPRLPKTLPADNQSACTQMLDAVVSFYEATEKSEARRTQRLAELQATREDDMSECVANTSIRAAACVTILLGDRDSEYPWLLDQCDRAFPANAG